MRNPRLDAAVLLIASALACSTPPPPRPPEQAPFAAQPSFYSVLHTSQRPTRQGDVISYGDAKDVAGCASDPNILPMPRGGGLLLRIAAVVPTDLTVQIETSLGGRNVATPQNLDDEDRFAANNKPYFYENTALLKDVTTGTLGARELAIWPGPLRDQRFDIAVRDHSFAPQAVGFDLLSAPMVVSLVGKCPDLAVALTRDSTTVRVGEIRRIHFKVTPSGDGVRSMTTAFQLTGLPKGVTATLAKTDITSADWIGVRENTFDLAVAPDAVKGQYPVAVHAVFGALDRTAILNLSVLPKDDY